MNVRPPTYRCFDGNLGPMEKHSNVPIPSSFVDFHHLHPPQRSEHISLALAYRWDVRLHSSKMVVQLVEETRRSFNKLLSFLCMLYIGIGLGTLENHVTLEPHAICVPYPRSPTTGLIDVPVAFDSDSTAVASPVQIWQAPCPCSK